jgi:hypothetical protein
MVDMVIIIKGILIGKMVINIVNVIYFAIVIMVILGIIKCRAKFDALCGCKK